MLETVADLVKALNAAGVAWCHWKSNESLDAALAGRTDLDLLIDPARRGDVETILMRCGFVPFREAPHRAFRDIDNAIAMDAATGQLVHVQSHYSLTLGEIGLKGYTLPWAHAILARRVPAGDWPEVRIASPDDELLLLIVRECLKLRWRDLPRMLAGRSWGGARVREEFAWLGDRVTEEAVAARADELIGEAFRPWVQRIRRQGIAVPAMWPASRALIGIAGERGWRHSNAFIALCRRWWRDGLLWLSRVQRRREWSGPLCPRHRVPCGTGLLVAVLGVDGAGKSTVTREILRQWGGKMDVHRFYLGSNEGLPRYVRRIVAALRKSPEGREMARPADAAPAAPRLPRGPGHILFAFAVLWHRQRVLARAVSLRDRGAIVFCDRFLQDRDAGFNDGPLLRHLLEAPERFKRLAAQIEARLHSRLAAVRPDLVVHLEIDADAAAARKPGDTRRSMLERKQAAFQDLESVPGTVVVRVDARPPLEAVVREVKLSVWRVLRAEGRNAK